MIGAGAPCFDVVWTADLLVESPKVNTTTAVDKDV